MVTVIDQNIGTLAGEKSGKKMISWIVLYIIPTVKQIEEWQLMWIWCTILNSFKLYQDKN